MRFRIQKSLINCVIWAMLMSFPIMAIGQNGNEKLFDVKSETEVILKVEHSKKLEQLKKNKFYKNVQLIKFGNVSKLSNDNNGVLPITIPGINKTLVAKPSEIEYISDENYVWKGDFKKADGYVKLICKNNEIFGSIQVDDKFFEIQSFEPGKNVLIEYNNDELSKTTCGNLNSTEHVDTKVIDQPNLLKSATITTRAEVRVLVLYTDAANSVVTNINNTATLAISQMNDALSNSAVYSNLVMTLAGVERLAFTETSDIITDADNLSINATANNLRNTHEADLVILLTDGNYDSNTTYGVVDNIGPINADAYAIVEADMSTSSRYTFAHEACHLFGGRHNDDPSGTYEHGYTFKTGIWPFRTDRYTIMCKTSGDTRILYYSNPDVQYNSQATGNATSNDVARKLETEALTVEAFRAFTPPLSAYISGPIKGYNSGTYTWSAVVSSGTSPYTYLWEYSLDGFNYTGTFGTSQSVTAPLPLDNDLYLRLTVNSSDGQSAIDFHTTLNLDAGSAAAIISKSATITPTTTIDPIQVKTAQIADDTDLFIPLKISIFPNPVSEGTTVSYFVSKNAFVQVEILNSDGKKVNALVSEKQDKGQHFINFNRNKLNSGIYFCKLTVDGKSTTTKFIVQ